MFYEAKAKVLWPRSDHTVAQIRSSYLTDNSQRMGSSFPGPARSLIRSLPFPNCYTELMIYLLAHWNCLQGPVWVRGGTERGGPQVTQIPFLYIPLMRFCGGIILRLRSYSYYEKRCSSIFQARSSVGTRLKEWQQAHHRQSTRRQHLRGSQCNAPVKRSGQASKEHPTTPSIPTLGSFTWSFLLQ